MSGRISITVPVFISSLISFQVNEKEPSNEIPPFLKKIAYCLIVHKIREKPVPNAVKIWVRHSKIPVADFLGDRTHNNSSIICSLIYCGRCQPFFDILATATNYLERQNDKRVHGFNPKCHLFDVFKAARMIPFRMNIFPARQSSFNLDQSDFEILRQCLLHPRHVGFVRRIPVGEAAWNKLLKTKLLSFCELVNVNRLIKSTSNRAVCFFLRNNHDTLKTATSQVLNSISKL